MVVLWVLRVGLVALMVAVLVVAVVAVMHAFVLVLMCWSLLYPAPVGAGSVPDLMCVLLMIPVAASASASAAAASAEVVVSLKV